MISSERRRKTNIVKSGGATIVFKTLGSVRGRMNFFMLVA